MTTEQSNGACAPSFSSAELERVLPCPFCGEADFDATGLKRHLLRGWCEVFENTDTATERTCTDERPCVNCFADQGECLGPCTRPVPEIFPGTMDALNNLTRSNDQGKPTPD